MWGSPDNGVNILLNQRVVSITKNLAAALKVFRADPDIADSWFWIDALCINQNDIDERNHQIKRMIDIYRASNHVLVWLGPESNNSATALGVIDGTYDKMMDALQKGGKPWYLGYQSLKENA
jgi:hypothetical protein